MQIPININAGPWIVHRMTRPQPYQWSVVRQISQSHWESLMEWPTRIHCRYATEEEADAARKWIIDFRNATGLDFDSETSKYAGSEALFTYTRRFYNFNI